MNENKNVPPEACENGKCIMRNLHNPITFELGLGNIFVCVNCFRTHQCDMQHDCTIINTQEGSVCTKTGFVYEELLSNYISAYVEPTFEPNVDSVNFVTVLLSYVYSYLIENADRYADIITKITENGHFVKRVEDAIFRTFNKVFKNGSLQKIPLSTISRLFTQLIVGGHASNTIYDHHIIKVSRRKKEDNILKRMRLEYGNALTE